MKMLKLFTVLLIIVPIFAFGNTIHINQNGTGSYYTIQAGIENANTGDTVLVYPGNYIEIVNFLGKDVVVASLFLTTQDTSYISRTIIDGNHEARTLVKFINDETVNAKLIGFTITNASPPKYKSDKQTSQGLGIYINRSSPVIESNHIVNNSYSNWYSNGGGICIENSSAKIINNIIRNNDMAQRGGGIYIYKCTNVLIDNNNIDDNSLTSGYGVAYGAGLYIDSSQHITIKNNTFSNNYNDFGYGGGIYIANSSNIKIINNGIYQNKSTGKSGGGIFAKKSSGIKIINNLLHNNHAGYYGGAIMCEDSEMLLANNTICFNRVEKYTSYGRGGGLSCSNSNPIVYNTILFFNTATAAGNQVFIDANSNPNFFYSNIEDGLAGFGFSEANTYDGLYENNIESDPQFTLSSKQPYNLKSSSACINAGSPDTTNLYIQETDFAGNIRIMQNTIDIGAYETLSINNIPYSYKSNNILIFPNPCSNQLTIRIPENQFQKGWAEVKNIQGNLVLKTPIEKQDDKINLSFLPKGIYTIKITSGTFIIAEKVVLY